MADIKIKIDTKSIAAQCKEFAKEAERDIKLGVAKLASQTHQEVLNMAQNGPDKLSSARKKFTDSVNFDDKTLGVFIISIAEEGMFVEEGIKPGTPMNTKAWLLKNDEGKGYKIIPFEWGRPPSDMPKKERDYVQDLRKELNAQNVGWKTIERNSKGSPRIGLLHEFNFGGPLPGKGNTPIFNRVRIEQKEKTDEQGKKFIQRNITTFRTVREDQVGKWVHPGLTPKHYLEKAETFFWKEWEEKVLPEIFRKWK